jgi:hypothetical protein
MRRFTQTSFLVITLLLMLVPADLMASSRRGRAASGHSAKCTGSTPCRACKNCRYCKHCAKDGGTCGVCRRADNQKRTWQTAGDESPSEDSARRQ